MRAFKKINFNKEKGAEKKRIVGNAGNNIVHQTLTKTYVLQLSHNSSGMSGRLVRSCVV